MMLAWLVSAALAAPLTVDDVVGAALSRDPSLAEAEAAVVAAEGERKAATGLRYDPTLEARFGFGLQQHEAALTQPISLSGEGIAAAKSADAALRAAEAELVRRELEVAAEARRLLIRAIAAHAEAQRSGEVLLLASELRAAAEARLASGDAPELDVHLARLEEAAAAADLVRARRDTLAIRVQLAATTGLPVDAELPDDPMTVAPSGSGAGERADQVAAAARVQSTDAAVRRERAAALSPVDLGAWAQVQAEEPGAPAAWWTVGPTVAVTLPVWSANRAGIARAEGERDVAAAELAAVEARIDAERAGSAARRGAVDAVARTADPTPVARAALAGVDAALSAGELGAADAALLRGQILDAWRRGASARASAAEVVVDLALAESWPSLLPGAS